MNISPYNIKNGICYIHINICNIIAAKRNCTSVFIDILFLNTMISLFFAEKIFL